MRDTGVRCRQSYALFALPVAGCVLSYRLLEARHYATGAVKQIGGAAFHNQVGAVDEMCDGP